MDILPEWAPNIHPMIIHFPIVLWLVAVFFDLFFLIKPNEWLRKTTMIMYVLGALAAFAAYLSGDQAIDMVSVPMQGEVSAGKHSDWGHYTLYYFATYAAIRILLFWKNWDKKKWVVILMFLLGATGVGLVAKTADMGGKLVYKYGVGTKK
ncbi:DUF2231 domain-containing protein [Roseivirga pacifica]|uniref:DUF2231 domain-containing protein n=1 Tax=Roseivirga pacifica TaxID=1267423 RepID=UPI003BA97F2F